MKDLTIALDDRPGALAEMGEALGRAGVSIEGGGVFVSGGVGIAHFLFDDAAAARQALEVAGIRVVAENEVLVQKLRQSEPAQLGKLARRMARYTGIGVVMSAPLHGRDNDEVGSRWRRRATGVRTPCRSGFRRPGARRRSSAPISRRSLRGWPSSPISNA